MCGTESKLSKFTDFRPELLGNSKRTVCQCVVDTLDTTVSIQRGKKLGYPLPMRTDYKETQNLKRYSVKDCPYHGLSGCSDFREHPSSYELESDKPVLTEIEHLKGKIGEGDFE